MSNIRETIKHKTALGTYTIEVMYDIHPENPREAWDNFGTMVCFHRRYRLGDEEESKQYSDYEHFLASLADVDYNEQYDTIYSTLPDTLTHRDRSRQAASETMTEIMKQIEEKYIILPLYLYDHSGITMSTGSFSDRWDSGQVGWIYASHEDALAQGWDSNDERQKEWREKYHPNKSVLEIAEDFLRSEVRVYDDYLTGQVYGYTVVDPHGNEQDSCWGYFGYDLKESGLLDDATSAADADARRRIGKHIEKVKTWIRNRVPLFHRKPLTIF